MAGAAEGSPYGPSTRLPRLNRLSRSWTSARPSGRSLLHSKPGNSSRSLDPGLCHLGHLKPLGQLLQLGRFEGQLEGDDPQTIGWAQVLKLLFEVRFGGRGRGVHAHALPINEALDRVVGGP